MTLRNFSHRIKLEELSFQMSQERKLPINIYTAHLDDVGDAHKHTHAQYNDITRALTSHSA